MVVDLQVPLAASLRKVLDMLAGLIGERELRLGGGSALATLWDHRFSTDVDLVCGRDRWEAAFTRANRLRLRDQLRAARAAGAGFSAIRVSAGIVGWNTTTGPVSIVPSRLPDSPDLWSDHTIRGTEVRLAFFRAILPRNPSTQSFRAILRGKLGGRLVGGRVAVARDRYDLAVALLETPDIAWSAIGETEDPRDTVLTAIHEAAQTKGAGRPVLRPAYPAIAADPWREALRIIEQGLGQADYEDVRPSK